VSRSAQHLVEYQRAFTYDRSAMLRTQITSGSERRGHSHAPGSISYAYDSRDRLLTDATEYAYDDNGNLVTSQARPRYTWDSRTGSSESTKTDGTVVEHPYDADGNRCRTRLQPPAAVPRLRTSWWTPLAR